MEIFTGKRRGRPRKVVADAVTVDKAAIGAGNNDVVGQTGGSGLAAQADDVGASERLALNAKKRREIMRQVDMLNMSI